MAQLQNLLFGLRFTPLSIQSSIAAAATAASAPRRITCPRRPALPRAAPAASRWSGRASCRRGRSRSIRPARASATRRASAVAKRPAPRKRHGPSDKPSMISLTDQGMMRRYLVPSSVAPAISPAWAKTSAITGSAVVRVSADRLPPWSIQAYSASAPADQPCEVRND